MRQYRQSKPGSTDNQSTNNKSSGLKRKRAARNRNIKDLIAIPEEDELDDFNNDDNQDLLLEQKAIYKELEKFAEISPKILTTICEIDENINQKTDFQKVNYPCKKLQFEYLSENSETLIDDKILKAIKFNPCSTYLIRKTLVFEKLELAIMSIVWSFDQETFEKSINSLEENNQNLLTVKNLPNDQVKLDFDSDFCRKNANAI